MKDKAIVEAMARLEGWEWLDTLECFNRQNFNSPMGYDALFVCGSNNLPQVPAYLTSHDAVQAVVDGLGRSGEWKDTDDELAHYQFYLTHISGGYRHTMIATPRQKCEAILKAKGLWEESE